jgi:hypothetical protein
VIECRRIEVIDAVPFVDETEEPLVRPGIGIDVQRHAPSVQPVDLRGGQVDRGTRHLPGDVAVRPADQHVLEIMASAARKEMERHPDPAVRRRDHVVGDVEHLVRGGEALERLSVGETESPAFGRIVDLPGGMGDGFRVFGGKAGEPAEHPGDAVMKVDVHLEPPDRTAESTTGRKRQQPLDVTSRRHNRRGRLAPSHGVRLRRWRARGANLTDSRRPGENGAAAE